jgi:hypothetical protein
VYGEPVQQGDTTVIPTAEVLGTLGFGVGEGAGDGGKGGYGAGGGGGGRSFSRPVAVIVIGPGGVEVKPVMDLTKIALAGITAWASCAPLRAHVPQETRIRVPGSSRTRRMLFIRRVRF